MALRCGSLRKHNMLASMASSSSLPITNFSAPAVYFCGLRSFTGVRPKLQDKVVMDVRGRRRHVARTAHGDRPAVWVSL